MALAVMLALHARPLAGACVITTFAGNGDSDTTGDGHPATQARLDVVYADGVDRCVVVQRVHRGRARYVWGNQDVAVRLEPVQTHVGSNVYENQCGQRLAAGHPNNADRAFWLGRQS